MALKAACDCECVRRFLLMGGHDYEASGGFDDLLSSHDTLDAAIQKANAMVLTVVDGRPKSEIDWWHVWDCDTRLMVAKSDGAAIRRQLKKVLLAQNTEEQIT